MPLVYRKLVWVSRLFILSSAVQIGLIGCLGRSGTAQINDVVPAAGNKSLQTTTPEKTVTNPTFTPSLLPTDTLIPTDNPTQTSTVTPTITHTQLPTLTPEPLRLFTTRELRPGVVPQNYLIDTCSYLDRRWSLDSSPPGTVVLPVMFHSVVKSGRRVSDPKDVSEEQFQAFVAEAKRLGFKTITTAQLINFLEDNQPIPVRSMIIILDDRRPGVVRDHFLPVLEVNDWTLTLAYIADPDSFSWAMDEIERLQDLSGRLDIQSHGFSGGLYIVEQTSEAEIENEIWASTIALETRFGQRPQAFIWPGGNFTSLAVDIARQDGYRLGFSAFSRGPLLFNWVPLGEPEQSVKDPLMVLPRAWSNSAIVNLYEAVRISDQARADAVERYPTEAAYFNQYCSADLPPLESVLPSQP